MHTTTRTCSIAWLRAWNLDSKTNYDQQHHLQRRRKLLDMLACVPCGSVRGAAERRKAQLFSASSDLHGTKNELCTSTVSSAGLWSGERAVDGAAVARFFARGLPAFSPEQTSGPSVAATRQHDHLKVKLNTAYRITAVCVTLSLSFV